MLTLRTTEVLMIPSITITSCSTVCMFYRLLYLIMTSICSLYEAIDTLNCFQFQSMTNMQFSNENHKIGWNMPFTKQQIRHLTFNIPNDSSSSCKWHNIYRIQASKLTRTPRKMVFFRGLFFLTFRENTLYRLRVSKKQSIAVQ